MTIQQVTVGHKIPTPTSSTTSAPSQPRNWKRFLRRGSDSSKSLPRTPNSSSYPKREQPIRSNSEQLRRHSDTFQKPMTGAAGSSSSNHNGPSGTTPRSGVPPLNLQRKGRIIPKLKIPGSFRKDKGSSSMTGEPSRDDFSKDPTYGSVLQQDSESSPSNPQSPYSTDSYVSAEVRNSSLTIHGFCGLGLFLDNATISWDVMHRCLSRLTCSYRPFVLKKC